MWPARHGAAHHVIADPRHALDADGAIRPIGSAGAGDPGLHLARLTALGRDEIATLSTGSRCEIADYLDILQLALAAHGHHPRELVKVRPTSPCPPHRHSRQRRRHGGRGPHPARGHGSADSRGGYIKRAPLRPTARKARRQRARGDGDARRGLHRQAVRRLRPISRCSSSPRADKSTRRRFRACRSQRRSRAARRSSICCR